MSDDTDVKNESSDDVKSFVVTQPMMSEMFGVSSAQFDKKYLTYISESNIISGTGRKKMFKPQAVQDIVKGMVADGVADPDMMGSNSPATERYRMAKAQLAEIQLEVARKNFVAIEDIKSGLMIVASAFRRAGESIKRDFGRNAQKIIEDALQDAQGAIAREFGSDDNAK